MCLLYSLGIHDNNGIIRSSKGGGGFSLCILCYCSHYVNSFTPNAPLNFAWIKAVKSLSRIKTELGGELFQFPVLIFNPGLSAVQ